MDSTSHKSSEGDSGHVLDRKSRKIAELEKLVKRMRNALVSLEEDNLNLNRKLKEQSPCPDLGLMTTWGSRSPPSQDRVCLDRPSQLEAEKVEVETSLRRAESMNKELEAEPKTLARAYGDVTTVNKSLERTNRRLEREKEILVEETRRCGDDGRSGERRGPDVEKQKLMERVVQLQMEVTHLTEELQKVQQASVADGGPDGRDPDGILLRRENRVLRESLDQSWLALRKAEGEAEGVREELERCLAALRTEKDLLREEVQRLHREYISLADRVASQLRMPTHGKGTPELEPGTEHTKSGGREFLVAHHSPPHRTTVDKSMASGMSEQIRVRFEDVQKRKQPRD